MSYQAESWSKPRRVSIRSTREVGELLFSHAFIVTNLSKTSRLNVCLRRTIKEARWEIILKKRKNSFFDKTDSLEFLENEARMIISLLAYNIVNFLRLICFDANWNGLRVNTIRLRLLKVAEKLVTTARLMHIKLSSSHVYQREFYNVFRQIQKIRKYI